MKRQITCLLLAITIMLSAIFAGCGQCGKDNSDSDKDNNKEITVDNYTATEKYTGGTHQLTMSESNTDLVKNGASDYKVIIKTNSSTKVLTSATEFIAGFKEATGVELTLVESDEQDYSATTKFISFGENTYATKAGVTKATELKTNGYMIKTVGQSVFVIGGGDKGTLFGAYGLLGLLFNYEYYFQDSFGNECYYIDTNVTEKKLPVFDVIDNPDFDHASAGYQPMYSNSDAAYKLRTERFEEIFIMGLNIPYVHNTLDYIPYTTYKDAHPDWFSQDGKQLCYTARGNSDERETLITEIANKMITLIQMNPEGELITLTHEDTAYWCDCDSCKALKTQYGTDAASCIMFTNEVADKVEAWRKVNAPSRKITVVMFAYTSTENPPAVKGSDGKYQAIDDKVKCRDNVCVLYAPIYTLSYNHTMQDEANQKTENQLQGWQACSNNVALWSYSQLFYNYFMPYDTYATYQNQYRRYLDIGSLLIIDNAAYDTKSPVCFSSLKTYLASSWSWDVNKNYNDLVDGFFENYFGKKDGAMRKFYDELRIWLKQLDESGLSGLTGTSHADWDKKENWSKPMLDRWVNYIAEAKKEVESLKNTNPEKYNLICDRIDIESLMPRYMLIEFYSDYYSAEELTAAKKSFASDCRRLNVTKLAENKDIEILIRNW